MTRTMRTVAAVLLALSILGCPKDSTVHFGAVLPLSGPAQAYGESIRRGVELAFEEAQQEEGFPYVMELEVVDSMTDPATGSRLLGELYDRGALAVIGGVTSAEALEMVKVADSRERILLSPTASSPELTGMSRNFFRIFPSDFVEGTKMGNFAAQKLKLQTAAILATQLPYGRGIQGVFKREFERHGGQVIEVIEYPPNTSDVGGLVERIMTLNPQPQGVYVAAFWEEIAGIIKALRRAKYEGKILTTAAFATPQAMVLTGAAADGVLFTQTVFDLASDSEPIRSFAEDYRRKYDEDPDFYVAHGYDAIKVLIEALKKSGTLPSDFWKGLVSLRSFPGVTGSLQFDEKGDVPKYPRVYIIKNGLPEDYEKYVQQIQDTFRARLQELEERRRRLNQQH